MYSPGICNTIGRVISGLLVVFIPRLSPLLVNNVCVTIAGFAVLFTPFCLTFTTMAVANAMYGLFAGMYVVSSLAIVKTFKQTYCSNHNDVRINV